MVKPLVLKALLSSFLFSTLYLLSSTTPTLAHTQTHTITLTESGFEPQELTVDQNSIITFINKAATDRWPASNVHPTHDLYPEFDPQKPIPPGQFWVFKPQQPGTWHYHDHLSPHQRGTLIVTPETSTQPPADQALPGTQPSNLISQLKTFFTTIFTRLKSIFSRSSPSSLNPQNFPALPETDQYKALATITQNQGAPAAWKFVQDTFQGDSGMTGNVHDLAHFVGSLIYKHQGFPGITTCTPEFAFGCFHGFLDTAFAQSLDDLPQAQTACFSLNPNLSLTGPVASCLHGIGHGIASFYTTTDLSSALTACDRLSQGQQFCHDGVFMEFARNAAANFYTSSDPLYPCNTFTDTLAFTCARNQTTVMAARFNFNFTQIASTCISSKNPDLIGGCIDSLGFTSASSASGNPNAIIKSCRQIQSLEYFARCASAAAGELIFQEVPGWQLSAPQVCDSLTGLDKTSCHNKLQQLIKDYSRNPQSLYRLKNPRESPSDYIVSQMDICYKNQGRDKCYQQVANLLSSQFSLKDILHAFQTNEHKPEIFSRCHETTHYLSRNEFTNTGSIPQVYASCDSTCHGGCYHGALEQYLSDQRLTPTSQDLSQVIPSICTQVKNSSRPLVYYECVHGLGHAAMFVTDMDVPLALNLCDALADPADRDRCYGGVFMENSSSSTNAEHPGKFIKADDPMYPCNSLDQKYLNTCYRYQSSHFALITKHDWSKVVDLCLQVPEKYQYDCVRTIGTNQVGFTQDEAVMRANCELLPTSEFKSTCLAGIITSFAYRYVGDADRMINFCSSVPVESQQSCFEQIGTSLTDWFSDTGQAKSTCDQIQNPTYALWCKQAS